MESACVYEQTTVIHELSQGIEMAKQLRLNLNSAEAREFLIQQILYSYDKALVVFISAEQPRANHLPESSLPKSSTTTGSSQSTEFEFHQNVVSRKRKASTQWEDEVRIWSTDNGLEGNTNDGYSYGQKEVLDLDPNFKFNDDDLHPLYFPNYLDDELLQGYSPPSISPATSESNYFTEWSSSSSLDLDLDPNFKFKDSFF